MTQSPVAPLQAGDDPAAETSLHPARSRRSAPRRGRVAAYVALTKPRIIELLLVTTLPSMILAAGGLPDWPVVVATMLGGSLAAGSANALNCYVDRDIDALMRRTGHRPLARHEVSARGALLFGGLLGLLAVAIMALVTTPLAAVLTAVAIGFYVVIYTMVLKRRTAQNIVWGGAAGCMPVLIGWSAVTGSLAWAPVVLFGVVFFWTPPHFWALATRYREDYARAGVPMLPVVASPQRVAREIVVYSWATAARLAAALAAGNRVGVRAAGGTGRAGAAHRSAPPTARHPARRQRQGRDGAVPPVEQLPGLRVRGRRRGRLPALSRRRSSPGLPTIDTMRPLLLATCSSLPAGDEDAAMLVAALEQEGLRATWAVWTDPGVDWGAAPVMLRSTWDYHGRRGEFLRWLAGLPHVENRADIVAWNTDKTYLRDLERARVPVVPSTFVEAGSPLPAPDGGRVRR